MLDKLIDFLIGILDLFRFFFAVREGDRVVVYTFGMPTRVVGHSDGWFGTGLHLRAPFNIENEDVTSTRDEFFRVSNQSLTTSEGASVHVRGIFRYAILPEKVQLFQTTLGDEDQALAAACEAAIAETIARHTLAELRDPNEESVLRKEILERARKDLNPYGFKVYDFRWNERVHVRTYRMITGE